MSLVSPSDFLKDSEYLTRRAILGTRTSLNYKDVLTPVSINDSFALEMKRLADLNARHFHIETNYYDLLSSVIGKVDKSSIRLPYNVTVFHLTYRQGSPYVILKQNEETKEITTIDASGIVVKDSEFLLEALAVCIALEAEIIGKVEMLNDLGKSPKRRSIASRSYKILEIKTITLISSIGNVNTGRKSPALHLRRGCWAKRGDKLFWRRSTIVGYITDGVVIKQYSTPVKSKSNTH